MSEVDLIATSTFGLEAVVARELHALGYEDAKPQGTGRVAFRADHAAICRSNLWLRTAGRVLVRVGAFDAPDFDALFEGTKALPWEAWIPSDGAFPVNGRSVNSTLTSVPACQRAVKRAIADRLMSAHGAASLPETGAPFAVEVSLLKDRATLTIDTSGAGLHRRGYRSLASGAQLRETLAAGLVELSFFDGQRPLADPFCGTGTIPIEAAMRARRMAPGLHRTFASEQWAAIDEALWDQADEEARDLMQRKSDAPIIATDIDAEILKLARYHAKQAGVEDDIHFQQRAFEDLRSKQDFGCVVTNPPYGERLDDRSAVQALYETFPRVFKGLPTWSFFILTSFPRFEKLIGREADRRRKLYNAKIECTYYQFHGPPPSVCDKPASHPDATTASREREITPVFEGLPEHAETQAELFRNCLARRAKHLRKWPKKGITCYRVYERNVPEVPLTVDRYEDHLHIAEHDRPHERNPAQHAEWLDLMSTTAADALDIPADRVFLKRRGRQRGLDQYEKVSDDSYMTIVNEAGLRFEVNLSDYVDTGLFLDHRLTRSMVRERASDKRFLNLFSYTGSFSVYAAAGGASATTSVDLSKTYLRWAERNLELNGFVSPDHRLVHADVIEFLEDEARSGAQYDLVVADPPTYSRSKRTETDWDVQAMHVELIERVLAVLAPGGLLYFSTNFRRFKMSDEIAGASIREISQQTVPEDYRNKRIHRCWVIRHAS